MRLRRLPALRRFRIDQESEELRVQLIGLGQTRDFRSFILDESAVWMSATPYVSTRHMKRRGECDTARVVRVSRGPNGFRTPGPERGACTSGPSRPGRNRSLAVRTDRRDRVHPALRVSAQGAASQATTARTARAASFVCGFQRQCLARSRWATRVTSASGCSDRPTPAPCEKTPSPGVTLSELVPAGNCRSL